MRKKGWRKLRSEKKALEGESRREDWATDKVTKCLTSSHFLRQMCMHV